MATVEMSKLCLIVVFFVLIGINNAYLKIDKVEIAGNEKYNKVSVTLDNSDPEKTKIDYFSEMISEKPLKRAKMLVVLKSAAETPKGEKLFRCGNEMIRTQIDVCKIGQIQSTTFAKVIMENFAKTSNFEIKCPLAPRNYSLSKFTVSENYFIRFPAEQKLCLNLVLSVSPEDKGKLETLWQLSAWIRFKKGNKGEYTLRKA